jgi:organic radical activating enzyme
MYARNNIIEFKMKVCEIFYSIQGEGFYAGTPAYFIRLAGCDVGCHWCDVKESWTAEESQLMDYDDLLNTIKQTNTQLVVITGGEPLMYDISALTDILKQNGYQINIETSGSSPLSGVLDWICVSPKKFKPVLPEVLAQADELKIIIFNRSDFKFAEEQASASITSQNGNNKTLKRYLQAEWSVREKMLPEIIEYVKNNPHWKISTQIHKYLDIR